MGQFLGAIPHGIIGDGDLVIRLVLCPLHIGLHNLHRVISPDDAMGWTDHIDGQVQCHDLVDLRLDKGSEGIQDVHKVFLRLSVQQRLVCHQVVEQFAACKVLSKCIHGEEDVIPGHIGSHGIWPMKHLHLHKDKFLAISDVKLISCVHGMEIPAMLAVLSLQTLNSLLGAVDRCIRDLRHQCRQGACVILLTVLHDDGIDLRKIDLRLQIVQPPFSVRGPDGVHQDGLLLLDQIRILARSIEGRQLVTMEGLQFPIQIADPAYVSLNCFSHSCSSAFNSLKALSLRPKLTNSTWPVSGRSYRTPSPWP